MENKRQCPDAGTWKTFLDGDVLDDAAADLAAHLEDCEACQQTLERLAAGKETWEGTARQLAEADAENAVVGIESSGHLRDVLDDLKQGVDVGKAATASSRDVLRFLEPSDEPDSIGRLDSYEIHEVVGAGGMGVVLRGWDPTLRRVVAIKVLAAHLANSAAAERRFVREAQAAAAVTHDHVVAIHAVEAGHEPPYLVMQYIEGKTLQERLDATGPLDVKEILRIGQQTAQGLAAAHRQGIVHRDIKPANILLENGVERVRITDFGLARAIDDASMTQSGVVAGTPLFMAPEQAQGQPVDHRSDLFSLGSVLYAMATGRPPFRSSTMMGVIRRVCDDQARPIREINPDVPDWLCGIIDRLLSKNPVERFQSADEVAELLAGCLAHVQHPLSSPLPEACRVAAGTKHVEENSESTGRSTGDSHLNEPSTARPQDVAESPSADGKRDRWAMLTSVPSKRDINARQRFLAAEEVEVEARRLIRFPALMIFVSGLCIAWETMSRFPALTAYDGPTVVYLLGHQTWNVLSILVCLVGAVRLLALRNPTLGYMAAVLPMTSYLTLPLGLPAGFWALMRLARPEVIRGFEHRAGRRSPEPLALPRQPAFGQIIARLLLLALLAITGALVRFSSIAMSGFSVHDEPLNRVGVTILVAAAVLILVGLIALYWIGYGTREEVATPVRYHEVAMSHRRPAPLQQQPTLGQRLARLLIIATLWLMAIAIPLVFYALSQDSGVFPNVGLPERMLLGMGALAVVFGLAFVLKRLERRRRLASGERGEQASFIRQVRRVPEVLICTLLAVFTMQAIYADLTALNYDRFMEAAVVPLFCVTLAALGMVVFINRRRLKELKAGGQEDSEVISAYRTAISVPLGLLVPVIVLLVLWGYHQSTVGYVTFDVDDSMSTVSFRNTATGEMRDWSASWQRVRLPAGKYEWSVSDGPMESMVIETGSLEVKPRVGQVLSARVGEDETLRRVVGTWKYVFGHVKWDSNDEVPPAWAKLPRQLTVDWDAVSEHHMVTFEFDDSGVQSSGEVFACTFDAATNPKSVALFRIPRSTPPEDWVCVADGYWQMGKNGLYLMLRPPSQPQLPGSYSIPVDRHVHYQFERVGTEETATETLQDRIEDESRRDEEELHRRINRGLRLAKTEAEVLAVQQARQGGRNYVEISVGSGDGFREGDDFTILRKNTGERDEYIAGIRLTLVQSDNSAGIVTERAKGKTVEPGDRAIYGNSTVPRRPEVENEADSSPQVIPSSEDRSSGELGLPDSL